MKKVVPFLAATVLSVAATTVHAENNIYVGLKSGSMKVDLDTGNFTEDDKSPFGLVAGYSLNKNVAIELEANKRDLRFFAGKDEIDGDISTVALYGVYRTEGDFFGKLKAGYLSEKIKLNRDSLKLKVKNSEGGLSVGAGAGYRFGDFSVEAEYTIIEKDVNFISLGLNYHF